MVGDRGDRYCGLDVTGDGEGAARLLRLRPRGVQGEEDRFVGSCKFEEDLGGVTGEGMFNAAL